ncbi:ABC transporter permease [Nocardiopsis suaedae]|uniref:ABC transporter permease n=1 Tax=Nocardiopsis suaedae TaxID=3018444 RepID=A0ABT4TJ94_9ACTN|nr:ABC transporter permease [Nocardiopsis suaedae]MDA2804746.1 ABC transporter permease [Nocardiopsis suaedae]
MITAVRVEALKLARSPVGGTATLALVLGIVVLLAGITAGVAGGDPRLIAKAGPAAALDWEGLVAGAHQIAAAAALLGFGSVLSWMFAREFTDRTITGLFALPVGRGRIALAKLTVHLLWAVLVGLVLPLGVAALGLLLGYGAPTAEAGGALARLSALVALTGILATPVAWIATVTRSLLAGVGGTIALVAIAQVGALAGAGGWMPLAAPALWAMSGGAAVNAVQLALVPVFGAAFTVLTCAAWARLQLTR